MRYEDIIKLSTVRKRDERMIHHSDDNLIGFNPFSGSINNIYRKVISNEYYLKKKSLIAVKDYLGGFCSKVMKIRKGVYYIPNPFYKYHLILLDEEDSLKIIKIDFDDALNDEQVTKKALNIQTEYITAAHQYYAIFGRGEKAVLKSLKIDVNSDVKQVYKDLLKLRIIGWENAPYKYPKMVNKNQRISEDGTEYLFSDGRVEAIK